LKGKPDENDGADDAGNAEMSNEGNTNKGVI